MSFGTSSTKLCIKADLKPSLRVNLSVQLANNTVSPHMIHAEVHPKISDSGVDRGQFPREFERPRRVEWFLSLDSTSHLLTHPSPAHFSILSSCLYHLLCTTTNHSQAQHSTASAKLTAFPPVVFLTATTSPLFLNSAKHFLAAGAPPTPLTPPENIDSLICSNTLVFMSAIVRDVKGLVRL